VHSHCALAVVWRNPRSLTQSYGISIASHVTDGKVWISWCCVQNQSTYEDQNSVCNPGHLLLQPRLSLSFSAPAREVWGTGRAMHRYALSLKAIICFYPPPWVIEYYSWILSLLLQDWIETQKYLRLFSPGVSVFIVFCLSGCGGNLRARHWFA
jgi:hypothetical protein